MGKDTDDLLSTGQAAKKLGLHPGTLVNWRTWGTGPKFVRIGRSIRYKPADISEWKKLDIYGRA